MFFCLGHITCFVILEANFSMNFTTTNHYHASKTYHLPLNKDVDRKLLVSRKHVQKQKQTSVLFNTLLTFFLFFAADKLFMG